MKGTDYCALWHTAEGWLLKGTAVGVLKSQRPMLANYEVHCDENWLTHRVHVERTIGKDTKTLSLSVENSGRWCCSGQEVAEVRGCLDVDLSVTPATDTLPSGDLTSVSARASRSPPLGLSSLSLNFNPFPNAGTHSGKYSSLRKRIPGSRLRSWSMISVS